MAGVSGYVEFNSPSTSYIIGGTLRINYQENYNQAANTSDLTITSLQIKTDTMNIGQAYNGNMVISIDGTPVIMLTVENNQAYLNYQGQYSTVYGSGSTVITGTKANIQHNADGTKTVAISVSANQYANPIFWGGSTGNMQFAAGHQNVALTTIPRAYTLSISAGYGSSITVRRGNTTLSDGAAIAYGDVLTISASLSPGYYLTSLQANNQNVQNGSTYTVTGNTSVTSTATLQTFTLSINAEPGSLISVIRQDSTVLSNGDPIIYGEPLHVYGAAQPGYSLASLTVNGVAVATGYVYTVAGNTAVAATATAVASVVSAQDGVFGSTVPITVTRYSNDYTHTLTMSCAGYSGTIIERTTVSPVNWVAPDWLMNYIPAATSAPCTIYCYTYYGNTLLGTTSVTITLTVPQGLGPAPSLSASDPWGYTAIYGGYVQGKSQLEVLVNDGLQYGATAAARSTSANGATYTAPNFTTNALVASGQQTISTTVRDSRGYTGTASTTITVLPYAAPAITIIAVHRTDQYGNADESGDYFVCDYGVIISPLNNINAAYLTMQYRKVGASVWTDVSIPLSAYTQSGTTAPIQIDTDSSYEVQLVARDNFSPVTRATLLSTTPSVISFKAGGKGVAFGKAAETDNLLESAWPIKSAGKVTLGADGTNAMDAVTVQQLEGFFHSYNVLISAKQYYTVAYPTGMSMSNTVLIGAMLSLYSQYYSEVAYNFGIQVILANDYIIVDATGAQDRVLGSYLKFCVVKA